MISRRCTRSGRLQYFYILVLRVPPPPPPREKPDPYSGMTLIPESTLPYVLALDLRRDTWRATERRLHFDSPTRTRVNSDSSVNDGYCFRLFSVDTSPSTSFPPFPSRTLPRSTRTMTDSGQLRSSISLLGNHAEFLLSRSTSALNTLQASHAL